MTNLVTYKLGDLGEIITGTTPPRQNPEYFSLSGVPFLTPSDMAFGRRHNLTERFLSPSGVEWAKNRILPPGASSVVCIGSTIGKVSQIDCPTLTNQQLNSVVPDLSKCDANFLYYSLLNMGSDLKHVAGGSTAPILNKTEFAQLEIKLPELMEQRRIAGVLGALDDKIESNSRTITLIERLQEETWRHNTKTVARDVSFLSQMVPVLGGTPSRKVQSNWVGSTAWASVRDLCSSPSRIVVDSVETINDELAASTRRMRPLPSGSVILTARGTVGKVITTAIPLSINQSAYGFVPGSVGSAITRMILNECVSELRMRARGSTFSSIVTEDFDSLRIPNPNNSEILRIRSYLEELEEKRIQAARENSQLKRLCDALLPELMSGRMRVDEAGWLVNEALDQEVR